MKNLDETFLKHVLCIFVIIGIPQTNRKKFCRKQFVDFRLCILPVVLALMNQYFKIVIQSSSFYGISISLMIKVSCTFSSVPLQKRNLYVPPDSGLNCKNDESTLLCGSHPVSSFFDVTIITFRSFPRIWYS